MIKCVDGLNCVFINVIQFWASIASMISMIKWQCHSYCYYYYYYYYNYIIIIIMLLLLSLLLLSLLLFMMCRFNEYAGFMWSSCHAGVVRFVLDGCYGRWFVYVKQRTASCWPLRCRRHVHSAENEFRWHECQSTLSVDHVDQSDQGNIPDAVTWACAVRTCIQWKHLCAANLEVVTRSCHVVAFLAETLCDRPHGIYPYWWLGWEGYVRRFPWRI